MFVLPKSGQNRDNKSSWISTNEKLKLRQTVGACLNFESEIGKLLEEIPFLHKQLRDLEYENGSLDKEVQNLW